MKIAIVNDLDMAVEVLSRLLTAAGHQVAWVARNGEQAIELAAKNTPELILMDMVMPGMNGVETTRRIMAESPCPILIVTVSVNENASLVFEAMGVGALDAVSTPAVGPDGKDQGVEEFLLKLRRIEKLLGQTSKAAVMKSAQRMSAKGGKKNLVAIGSSTGGPNAVAAVLKGIPVDFPAAIVIVQHVDMAFASGFVNWLKTQTKLKVKVAEQGDILEHGTVYVAATNNHLQLTSHSRLAYTTGYSEIVYRPSVDVFFNSVAEHWNGNSVAVLLTGMGKDGAAGLLRLHQKGVYTIAQDQASCAVYGMPKAATEMGAANAVLAIDDIAQAVKARVERFK